MRGPRIALLSRSVRHRTFTQLSQPIRRANGQRTRSQVAFSMRNAPVSAAAFSSRAGLCSNSNAHRENSQRLRLGTVAAASIAAATVFGWRESETESNGEVRVEKKKKEGALKLFCGNANHQLVTEVAEALSCPVGKATVSKFEDGEVNVMIHENVRGKDVYIVQPTCTPVNENLMELMLMISTLRRASARRITAVIPYYGYARQDRKMTARVPISAADVARLLEAMGVDRVVAVDLHCGQIQGFFGPRVPVDNLDGGMVGIDYFGKKDLKDPVVISPDAGGVYRAKKFREGLKKMHNVDAGLAMIIKQRQKAGEIAQMDLVGSVEGCDVIIVDDMIDTAGTLCKAAKELKQRGANKVYAFASHGIFSGPANGRIARSELEEVCVTNSIPRNHETASNEKIKVLSIANLIASAIKRIHEKKSVSELFDQSVAN